MSDYDAIVVGAGHNGLTAAAILQRGGLRTVCLEANHYAGGMAASVELVDGFHFEIAGSVQFPTPGVIREDLGLDTLPTVEPDVMSTNITDSGPPLIFYRDPMRLMTHLGEAHGNEAVMGMAAMFLWAQAPSRALGRFDIRQRPKTYDEMYACATNEQERQSITDMLFGSVTDVVDRHLPDKEKHASLRAMLSYLAVNTTYRGPATPGSAAGLAYGLASPPDGMPMMTKFAGGVGAVPVHLLRMFTDHGGELRLRTKVRAILTGDGRVSGVRLEDGSTITAPIVVSNLSPDLTLTELVDPSALPADLVTRVSHVDHRGAYLQMHFALDGRPEFAAPYELLNEPGMQESIALFSTAEQLQQQWEDCRHGHVPREPSVALQIPSDIDDSLAPSGKHAASAFALWFPVEAQHDNYSSLRAEMARRVIAKITRYAPNFENLIIRNTTFAPMNMERMFGAPGGDFCQGLLHPDQIGTNRPGPRGFTDLPIPLEGLYLCGAGCHGGPGITFIPGYNAGYQALEDAGRQG